MDVPPLLALEVIASKNLAEGLLVYDDSVDRECLLHYSIACGSHAIAPKRLRGASTTAEHMPELIYNGCQQKQIGDTAMCKFL